MSTTKGIKKQIEQIEADLSLIQQELGVDVVKETLRLAKQAAEKKLPREHEPFSGELESREDCFTRTFYESLVGHLERHFPEAPEFPKAGSVMCSMEPGFPDFNGRVVKAWATQRGFKAKLSREALKEVLDLAAGVAYAIRDLEGDRQLRAAARGRFVHDFVPGLN